MRISNFTRQVMKMNPPKRIVQEVERRIAEIRERKSKEPMPNPSRLPDRLIRVVHCFPPLEIQDDYECHQ